MRPRRSDANWLRLFLPLSPEGVMTQLLAKSPKYGCPDVSLEKHTRDVVEAAVTMFGTADKPTRLGRCWLRFFKLADTDWPAFRANLIAACVLHDWGKA